MANGHGGARKGAGRKPKALIYASETRMVEGRIARALPRILTKMVAMAEAGDGPSQRYLMDRILGRVATLKVAPSKDTSMPYTEDDLEIALVDHFLRHTLKQKTQDRRLDDLFIHLADEDAEEDIPENGAEADAPEKDAENGAGDAPDESVDEAPTHVEQAVEEPPAEIDEDTAPTQEASAVPHRDQESPVDTEPRAEDEGDGVVPDCPEGLDTPTVDAYGRPVDVVAVGAEGPGDTDEATDGDPSYADDGDGKYEDWEKDRDEDEDEEDEGENGSESAPPEYPRKTMVQTSSGRSVIVYEY